MREISAGRITEVIKRLCIEANCHLPKDVKNCIEGCHAAEPWAPAREIQSGSSKTTTSPTMKMCPSARIPALPACS